MGVEANNSAVVVVDWGLFVSWWIWGRMWCGNEP